MLVLFLMIINNINNELSISIRKINKCLPTKHRLSVLTLSPVSNYLV